MACWIDSIAGCSALSWAMKGWTGMDRPWESVVGRGRSLILVGGRLMLYPERVKDSSSMKPSSSRVQYKGW